MRRSPGSYPLGGSGDRYQIDRGELVKEGLRLYRDSVIMRSIVDRATDILIGTGFKLESLSKSSRLRRRIEEDFAEYSESFESRGQFSFADMEVQVARSLMVQGDILALKHKDGRLQFFESEQITHASANAVRKKKAGISVGGVELDSYGAPTGYWLAPYGNSGIVEIRNAKLHPAKDCIFVANLERYSSTRGTGRLIPAYPMIHRISSVCDSEAIAWQLLSKVSFAITREQGSAVAYSESEAESSADQPPDMAGRFSEYDEGLVFHGKDGEGVAAISRELPGASFPESVRMFLRLAGMVAGLPLEVILADFAKTNYSASRAALEQTFRCYLTQQRHLKRTYHTPVFTNWLDRRIAAGAYPDRPDTRRHNWTAQEFPWVDQLKESQAMASRIQVGISSQSDALRSLNKDRELFLEQRRKEVEDSIAVAEKLNADHPGANVDWRMFAGMPVSKQPVEVEPEAKQEEAQANDSQV